VDASALRAARTTHFHQEVIPLGNLPASQLTCGNQVPNSKSYSEFLPAILVFRNP
jgi:hypothetical protein